MFFVFVFGEIGSEFSDIIGVYSLRLSLRSWRASRRREEREDRNGKDSRRRMFFF